ncbi:hypothetical protein BD413DRAFT_481533 [Trametes elegans]|nr:hypothetical protein BD413DRAFT_481533 [Trametes elegans]
MRVHPLRANLEHVASSSSVASPPRTPFRSGLGQSHDPADSSRSCEEDPLAASAQPAFRVAMRPPFLVPFLEGGVHGMPADETRRHRCPQCGKGFKRPSSLVTHLNTHTGAKPFPCLFGGCPRRFNVKSNMRRHYQRHLRAPRPQPGSRAGSDVFASPSSGCRSPTPGSSELSSSIGALDRQLPASTAFDGQS